MNMPTDITDPLKKSCTAEVVFYSSTCRIHYITAIVLIYLKTYQCYYTFVIKPWHLDFDTFVKHSKSHCKSR